MEKIIGTVIGIGRYEKLISVIIGIGRYGKTMIVRPLNKTFFFQFSKNLGLLKILNLHQMMKIKKLLSLLTNQLHQPTNVNSVTKHLPIHIMSNFTSKLIMNRVGFLNAQHVTKHLTLKISSKCTFLQHIQPTVS